MKTVAQTWVCSLAPLAGGAPAGATASWPGIAVRRTASLPLAYVPAIHGVPLSAKNVDARDKPGHDDLCGN